jgi:hypothetical protein
MNRLTQFVILSGMGKRWLPDEMIAEINGNFIWRTNSASSYCIPASRGRTRTRRAA